jgi:hypothetical protein
MSSKGKRRVAIWGGLLAGLGLGACLAWALNIFEIAHPENASSCAGYDCSLSLYPNPAWTVLVLLIFCGAIGVGLSLVASALIRNEDVRQGGEATPTDPAGAAAGGPKPERRIFGFLVDS